MRDFLRIPLLRLGLILIVMCAVGIFLWIIQQRFAAQHEVRVAAQLARLEQCLTVNDVACFTDAMNRLQELNATAQVHQRVIPLLRNHSRNLIEQRAWSQAEAWLLAGLRIYPADHLLRSELQTLYRQWLMTGPLQMDVWIRMFFYRHYYPLEEPR